MALGEIILGGLATLIATLIGVATAFKLERRTEKRQQRREVLQHLKAVQKELEQNSNVGWGNFSLLRRMQERDPEADHYAPELFVTDAWDAAIQQQLIDIVPTDLYHELQELYQQTKSTNELIRRLRIEAVHPEIGETMQSGGWEYERWTYSVHYYDSESEEVDRIGLGIRVMKTGRQIANNADSLQERIEEEIEEVEEELDDSQTRVDTWVERLMKSLS